jgi:hypothetical protein
VGLWDAWFVTFAARLVKRGNFVVTSDEAASKV